MSGLAARPFLVYAALHGLLFMGLFQLGFTPDEWSAREQRARAIGLGTSHLVRDEQGGLGLLRAYLRTDSDERLYREYARLALTGQADLGYIAHKQYAEPIAQPIRSRAQPYRDVRIEYPPLALYLGMLPPALWGSSYRDYRFGIGAYCWLLTMLSLWLTAHGLPRPAQPAVLRGSLLFCLLLGNIVATRLDALVALTCLAGTLAAERSLASQGRSAARWAGVTGAVLALGALIKLAPGLLLAPVGLIMLRSRAPDRVRRSVWLLASAVSVGAAIHVLSLAIFGSGYLATFGYHAARGIQLESSYAGLLLLARWFGLPASLELAHGSSNVVSALSPACASAAPWLFLSLAACLLWSGLSWSTSRAGTPDLLLPALLVLVSFLLTNKVFSPQYLIWIAPLVLLDAARSGRRSLLYLLWAAALLSQVLYPRAYGALKSFAPGLVLVLNVRNLLVLALLLSGWRRLRQSEPQPARLEAASYA